MFKFYHLLFDPIRHRIIRGGDMLSYEELLRENDYLRGCLGLEEYVYERYSRGSGSFVVKGI